MWISSSSSSSVVFLYTGLSKFMLLVFFRFQFLQMRYPPMHSKPMTTKERGEEGLLASLWGVCGSAGLFPNTYPPWDNFVAARLLLPSSAVLNSFPPPTLRVRRVYLWQHLVLSSKVKPHQLTNRNDYSNNSRCHSRIKALVIICICNYRNSSDHLTHLLDLKLCLKNVLW